MKKLILLLSTFTILILNGMSSISFWSEEIISENSNEQIQKAELIYTYILEINDQIDLFKEKYSINPSENLKKEIRELNHMSYILKSIQTGEIDESTWKEAIPLVIERLKKSKNNIKNILQNEKNSFERNLKKKKEGFSKLWEKVSKQLDEIIRQIFRVMKKRGFGKDGIWEREEKIMKSINVLFKENIKLQRFWKQEFHSEKEMKVKFLRILKNIKREMLILKKTWLN